MEHTQPEQEPTQTQPTFADTKKGNVTTVLGIIVIIILLALGGLYYFTQGIEQIPSYNSSEGELEAAENEADAMRSQSDSTDLADIEADVTSTDFSGLEESSADFDAELEAE